MQLERTLSFAGLNGEAVELRPGAYLMQARAHGELVLRPASGQHGHSLAAAAAWHDLGLAGPLDANISGDGRYIVFVAVGPDNTADIMLYDRIIETLVSLPDLSLPGANETKPAFCCQARYIVYESNIRGNGNVMLYDRKLQAKVPLPGLNSDTAFDGYPGVGAKGNIISFYSDRTGNGDIVLYDRTVGAVVPTQGLNVRNPFSVDQALLC